MGVCWAYFNWFMDQAAKMKNEASLPPGLAGQCPNRPHGAGAYAHPSVRALPSVGGGCYERSR